MTLVGSPLADGRSIAITADEVDALSDRYPQQEVEDAGDSWTYLDPNGRRRHVPRDYELPRLHGEHRSNHLGANVRDRSRGFVLLTPPGWGDQ